MEVLPEAFWQRCHCISYAMRSIICRAKLLMTVWWNYAGSTIGAMPRKSAGIGGLAASVAGKLSAAL